MNGCVQFFFRLKRNNGRRDTKQQCVVMMSKIIKYAKYITLGLLVLVFAKLSVSYFGVGYVVRTPSFYPDNETIIFSHCGFADCHLATYNPASAKYYIFPKPAFETWFFPRVSTDGKKIVFVIRKFGSSEHKIAIMDADGTNLEVVSSPNIDMPVAYSPSFSPDDRSIVFVRGRIRGSGANPLTGRDLFLLNLDDGKEVQLTNFQFYQISAPYFYQNSKQILFGAYGPSNTSQITPGEMGLYDGDRIHLLGGGGPNSIEKVGLAPFLTYGKDASDPSVSLSDEILFVSITNEMDGATGLFNYDLFIKHNGKIDRLTDWHSSFSEGGMKEGGARVITNAALSPDGKKAVFTQQKDHLQNVFWVIGTKDGSETRIDVPFMP